ncbi:MAG TPA: DUF4160 domain-containing protein [Nitrosopumilaceae archaeon]|jgi:hypothetical protein|nr:DUF4160 domain-containing protein [Nitrosopumilaceae archaeon]
MAPLLIDKEGIRICVHSREHLPPHVHVFYGEDEVLVNIRTAEILAGSISGKKLRIVLEWLGNGKNRKIAEENFYELNPALRPEEVKERVSAKKRRKGR